MEERAYQVRAPVQRDGIGRKLTDQILSSEVTLELRDLASVSPEVRETIRRDLTKSRRPVKPNHVKQVMFKEEQDVLPFLDEEEDLKLEYDALNLSELPIVSSVFVTTIADGDIPVGSVVIPDPYVQYLESLAPGEVPKQVFVDPKQIYVARDSAHLRVVFPNINTQGKVESIMDSGSQIVSISLDQAAESRLTWDPDIQIYMQSANRSLERSVGLAKNVPFTFGGITVYLQAHVIRGPAYKVLLGRPFEVLTECQINNSRDESQTITLKDPNTGKRCTMITFPRGKESEGKSKVQDKEEEERLGPTADPDMVNQGFRQASMN
jgi:hypothetical protein